MGRVYNLIDIGFASLTKDEKRESFIMLDVALKKIHEKDFKVESFDPKDIYYQDGIYFYSKVSPINKSIDSKEDVVLDNIIGLSDLAFCSYLPSYDLSNGLLNGKVLNEQFDKFGSIFTIEDKNYYRSVLVDAYTNHKLPDNVYYSDYILGNEKNNNSNSNSRAYVKATEAGKLYADMMDEAAFGNTFFFVCMVTTMIIAFIGLAIIFLK